MHGRIRERKRADQGTGNGGGPRRRREGRGGVSFSDTVTGWGEEVRGTGVSERAMNQIHGRLYVP